jgi:glycyl-tRNA synthetase (class II)
MFICPAVQVTESTERAQAVEAALAAEGATTINLDGREIRVAREGTDGKRRVLSFPAAIAPVKCSLLPLDQRVDPAVCVCVLVVVFLCVPPATYPQGNLPLPFDR